LRDVLQCVPIERRVECFLCFGEDAAESAHRTNDTPIRAGIETLHQRRISFRSPNEGTEINTARRASKFDSTTAPARVVKHALLAQEMYHLG